MEAIRRNLNRLRILCHLCLVANLFFIHSDARNSKHSKILDVAKSLNMIIDVTLLNESYNDVSSPLTLPPYDSLSLMPLTDSNNPPYCVPSPNVPQLGPPLSPIGRTQPSPFASVPNQPYSEPSPPSPPVFQPPVVFPPPTGPPPRSSGREWCVAKPSVPDPIIEEAMSYACGSGADCGQIQPNGPCFKPNSMLAHASYAFNSYFQRTRVAGGTCDFGGTAMLVTIDPGYEGCHFVTY